jgi:hypothetical protein
MTAVLVVAPSAWSPPGLSLAGWYLQGVRRTRPRWTGQLAKAVRFASRSEACAWVDFMWPVLRAERRFELVDDVDLATAIAVAKQAAEALAALYVVREAFAASGTPPCSVCASLGTRAPCLGCALSRGFLYAAPARAVDNLRALNMVVTDRLGIDRPSVARLLERLGPNGDHARTRRALLRFTARLSAAVMAASTWRVAVTPEAPALRGLWEAHL